LDKKSLHVRAANKVSAGGNASGSESTITFDPWKGRRTNA